MKKKEKGIKLKKPSLVARVWKTWLYNVIVSVIVFYSFFGFFTIEELAYELDYFTLYWNVDLRWQAIYAGVTFVLCFRQFFKFLNLIKFTRLSAKRDVEVVDRKEYKRLIDGVEGAGKTLTVINDSLLVAVHNNELMRLQYYLKYPFREALKNDVDFNVLEHTFEFYERNTDKIPNFMASCNVKYDDRTQYNFDVKYFDQKKRPPDYVSLALPEIANVFPNRESKLSKDIEKDKQNFIKKNETFSLSRQWFQMTIFGDDQRLTEVFLGFRANATGRSIIERKNVLKPKFLEFLLECLKKSILKREKLTTKLLSRAYVKLGDLIQDIGFYAFTIVPKDTDTGRALSTPVREVIPCDLFFDFDTRDERKRYKLYNNDPE